MFGHYFTASAKTGDTRLPLNTDKTVLVSDRWYGELVLQPYVHAQPAASNERSQDQSI